MTELKQTSWTKIHNEGENLISADRGAAPAGTADA